MILQVLESIFEQEWMKLLIIINSIFCKKIVTFTTKWLQNAFQILSHLSSYSSSLIYKFASRRKIIKFSQPRFLQPLGKRSFDNSRPFIIPRVENSVSGFGENFMGYPMVEGRGGKFDFNFSSTRGR